ncbi:MAG TPA: hypothetical protein VHD63_21265, partial [Ktedonobacteraceae bacterium]|nr:hypothetical protein [Ktedonobacteraceae bacterium]
QVEMSFDRAESQFDIPSASIEEYDVRKRQEMRSEHIGQIATVPAIFLVFFACSHLSIFAPYTSSSCE